MERGLGLRQEAWVLCEACLGLGAERGLQGARGSAALCFAPSMCVRGSWVGAGLLVPYVNKTGVPLKRLGGRSNLCRCCVVPSCSALVV